ncbi:MAG: hypothetical protein JW723_01610 [Bacteroidales bacterium]|nr:hypothetical protein [Bacteroidales bacterium]
MKKIIFCITLLYSCQLFSQPLTIEQVRADIDSVISVLTSIHPTFSESLKKQELFLVRDTISNSMTNYALFKTLQPLIALDGHTTLQFNGEVVPKTENPLLPFETIIFQNKLYVKSNLSKDTSIVTGCEIMKINKEKASIAIENILKYIPGEKIENKIRKLDNNGFANWYRLVYGNYETFEIEYKSQDGIKTTMFEGAHWKQFPKYEKKSLKFKIIDSDIAYLEVGRFSNPKKFLSFIDSVFLEIKNQHIDNLIIDITQGGGFSMLADSLLSYITEKPYRELEKKKIKISKETQEYINEIRENGEQKGEYFVFTKKLQSPVKRPNHFSGNVYILTSPKAYSASTMFVAMAKCYSSSIIVGEETGQPLISNGDISRHELRNSGMNLYTSHSIYYLPCAENEQDGVKPDIEVKMTLNDLLNDNNKYLEYTVDLIKQQENE